MGRAEMEEGGGGGKGERLRWPAQSPLPTLSRLAAPAWMACWTVILIAGLWPLKFHVPNGATWLRSEDGIRFNGDGEVYCRESLQEILLASNSQTFSLELLVRPRSQEHPHVAYIVSNSNRQGRPTLLLLQYGSLLILQAHFRGALEPAFRKLGVDGALPSGQLVHIAVVSGPQGTRLYVDGVERERNSRRIAREDLTGPLILGNSGRPGYGWKGDLLGFAIYPYAKTEQQVRDNAGPGKARQPGDAGAAYTFSERSGEWTYPAGGHGPPLRVSPYLEILHRSTLAWDLMLDRPGLWDITENILGFVPFGFLGAAVFAARRPLRTAIVAMIVVGFLLSLGIELTQAFLPGRDSSLVDLTMNTLGTAAGALLLAVHRR